MHIKYIIPLCITLLSSSCRVSRIITTTAESTKTDDKTVTITTRTEETYHGEKR